jgi:hypothetical protein
MMAQPMVRHWPEEYMKRASPLTLLSALLGQQASGSAELCCSIWYGAAALLKSQDTVARRPALCGRVPGRSLYLR